MSTYSIRPLALSRGPRDLSQYTFRMNTGVPTESVCYIWYIEGTKPKTIVDAGTFGPRDNQITPVNDAFNKIGVAPEEIEQVILTHLHVDHVSLAHTFKNAKFFVQKTEWDYAFNPHPIDAFIYVRKLYEDLNVEKVEGDKEIMPGISVFLTPGHSAGGQSVEIKTSAGKAVITGFCSHLKTFEQNDMMKRWGWEVSAPIIHLDVRQCYDSALKVKRRADIILPIHDPSFANKTRIPA